MDAKRTSPVAWRSARRIAAALAVDPSLGRDEARLADVICRELEVEAKIARIPACLRDDSPG
jgi:hypothetical protein